MATLPIFIILGFISLIVLLIWLMPSKGAIGEKRVAKLLAKRLPDDYILVNDITIPCELGTTQIDHIVFSIYGVFVIETKNYTGWITGTDNSEYWQKNMYGYKYKFRNPLKQNYAHLKALQSIIPLGDYCFHPIVTFSNSTTIYTQCRGTVVRNRDLINTILQYKSTVIPQTELQSVVDKVLSSALIEKGTNKQHIKNVKENVKTRNQKIKHGICPQCGGTLIERKGKYGKFYGCSNYPKCHFIVK